MKVFISVKRLHVFLHSNTSLRRTCKRTQQLKALTPLSKDREGFVSMGPASGQVRSEEALACGCPWGLEPARGDREGFQGC